MTDPKEQGNAGTTKPLMKTKTILRNKIHSTITKKAQAENFKEVTPGGSPGLQGEDGGWQQGS